MRRATVAALLVVVASACGQGSSPSPGGPSSCTLPDDSIYVVSDVISVAAASLPSKACHPLAAGDEADARSGGSGSATFVQTGWCTFNQLPSAGSSPSPAKPAKTARLVSRPPGAIFQLTDGFAQCTIGKTMNVRLCGSVTLLATGVPLQAGLACNSDPTVDIAVYRGSATLRLEATNPVKTFSLVTGQSVHADPVTGASIPGTATPSRDQVALFEAQLDAEVTGGSFADTSALLAIKSLPPSDAILAPNVVQTQLGSAYGKPPAMCKLVNASALFYPSDPKSPTPSLAGSACAAQRVNVYGVVVFQPLRMFYRGGLYFQAAGGVPVKRMAFTTPITLQEASSAVFNWDGSVDQPATAGPSPAPSVAAPGIYVVHVVYSLPPDPTPRIVLVAISLGGAPFPSIG